MSCCCPSGEGIRKKERLVRQEKQEEEEEESRRRRRSMDVSLLREQYKCSRETQRHTQVLLRTVSEELSEAVSVVPVTQGLTSPWEPNKVTFDPDLATCGDTWRVHLDLHRRGWPGVTARRATPSPEPTTNGNSSFRHSSSSSSSSCSSTEEVHADGSRGDPGVGVSDGSRGDHPPTSLQKDLKEDQTSTVVPLADPPSAWRGSRKFSAPALMRFTRQLSVEGVGSSTGVHQNQNHHPFPNRKTPRISEAARRLGMYSSF